MSDEQYEPMEGTLLYQWRELRWRCRDLVDMIAEDLGFEPPEEYPRSESTREVLNDE